MLGALQPLFTSQYVTWITQSVAIISCFSPSDCPTLILGLRSHSPSIYPVCDIPCHLGVTQSAQKDVQHPHKIPFSTGLEHLHVLVLREVLEMALSSDSLTPQSTAHINHPW